MKKNPLFIVNPEIIFKSKELVSYEEGCLSIPNQFAEIKRPSSCKISFLDYNGEKKRDERRRTFSYLYPA